MSNPDVSLDALAAELRGGRPAALCAIVGTRGSTPQPAGTVVCVDGSGRMIGTLGGGCVEADVRLRARDVLSSGQSKLLQFELTHEIAIDEGMICGGRMDVAVALFADPQAADDIADVVAAIRAGEAATLPLRVETSTGPCEYQLRVEAQPRLVIAGGGHVGRLVAEMMVPLGFRVSVVDDREEFANSQRFPAPIEPVVGDIPQVLSTWPVDANTYFVFVTRGHKFDQRALGAVLNSPARYFGMIGSRRKISITFRDLRHEGATEEQLSRVHAPIGLDINSVTAEEIAVSIAAELISVRRRDRRPAVEGPFPIDGAD